MRVWRLVFMVIHAVWGLRDLEKYILDVMKCYRIPAASIVIIKDDVAVLVDGFGMADIEEGIKSTKDTKFFIGSLTKGFSSVLLAKLLETSKNVTWDTPLTQFLGSEFSLSSQMLTENVNLRDVLAHRLGIPSYFNALLAGQPWHLTRFDIIRRLKYLNATDLFRSSFHYNNVLYVLAGYASEVLSNSGKSWEKLLQENLLSPLGMDSSGSVSRNMNFDSNFARPYVQKGGNFTKLSDELVYQVHPFGPAGAIYSTARDMEKWLRFHLDKGYSRHQKSRLLSPDSLAETYEPASANAFRIYDLSRSDYPASEINVGYGLSWVKSFYQGHTKIWHTGSISTFSSVAAFLPRRRSAVAFMFSGRKDRSIRSPNRVLLYRILDYLLDENPWLNSTTACSFPAPWSRRTPSETRYHQFPFRLPVRPLIDYTGVYGNLFFGNLTIFVRNSHLWIKYGQFARIKLTYTNKNHLFAGKYIGVLWFESDSDDSKTIIPVEFKEGTTGSIDFLYYPMASDISQKPFLFVRNLNFHESTYDHKPDNHEKCRPSIASMLSAPFLIVISTFYLYL